MFLNNVNLFSVLVVATWGPGSQITDNFFIKDGVLGIHYLIRTAHHPRSLWNALNILLNQEKVGSLTEDEFATFFRNNVNTTCDWLSALDRRLYD